MPTYDYQCSSCKHEFTALHKISDPAPPCPECGAQAQKKLSAPAVRGQKAAPNPPPGCGMGGCGCKH